MCANYRHTQISWLGRLRIVPFFAFIALGHSLGWRFRDGDLGMLLTFMVPLTLYMLIFSSLTVEVTADALTWFFGLGLFHNTLSLDEVARSEVIQLQTYWGEKNTPRGKVSDVGGSRGVEIVCRDGTTLQIGSEEPEALAAAISSRGGGDVSRGAPAPWTH